MHQVQKTGRPPFNDPAVLLVTRRLAEFFKVLSNPRRLLILEELRSGERDVSSLTDSLQVCQSTMSQQIAILKAHKLIDERKEGRTVFYRLRNPDLPTWIDDGVRFTGHHSTDAEAFLSAIRHNKTVWQPNSSRAEEADAAAGLERLKP